MKIGWVKLNFDNLGKENKQQKMDFAVLQLKKKSKSPNEIQGNPEYQIQGNSVC